MAQAIRVRYKGPTDHQGARYVVDADSGVRKIYPQDYTKDPTDNAIEAARKYAAHMGWAGSWIRGATPDGWIFVRAEPPAFIVAP